MTKPELLNCEVDINQNSHFSLHQNCFLVKGALRGALYDLSSGHVYSINQSAVHLLEQLESGRSIYEIAFSADGNFTDVASYLRRLKDLNLGDFMRGTGKFKAKPVLNTPLISFAHIEITAKCNHRCRHCYTSGGETMLHQKEMAVGDYQRVLNDIYANGCRNIQFIGGEPFVRRKVLCSVVDMAKQIGFEKIEIFSNAAMINQDDLQWLKNHGVHLAVSIHGSRSEIHDDITQTRGSWDRSTTAIKKAVALMIPVRLAMTVSNRNEDDIEKTMAFARNELGVEEIKTDYVRPSGRGCSSELLSHDICEKQRFSKPAFSRITEAAFWQTQNGHNCYKRKICISPYGDVFPCIMERTIKYGNILATPLRDILASELANLFRSLSKDKIEGCQDCEFRYCCFDCRVKDRAFDSSNIYAKPWWCDYDPYSGLWSSEKHDFSTRASIQ